MDELKGREIDGRYRLRRHLGQGPLGELFHVERIRAEPVKAERKKVPRIWDRDGTIPLDGSRTSAGLDGACLELIRSSANVDGLALERFAGLRFSRLLPAFEAGHVPEASSMAPWSHWLVTPERGETLATLIEKDRESVDPAGLLVDLVLAADWLIARKLVPDIRPENVYWNGDVWCLGPSGKIAERADPVETGERIHVLFRHLGLSGMADRVQTALERLSCGEAALATLIGHTRRTVPRIVRSLRVVSRAGDRVLVGCSLEHLGRVELLSLKPEDSFPPVGRLCPVEDLLSLGSPMPPLTHERPQRPVSMPTAERIALVPVGVVGSLGRIGRPLALSPVPEPKNLRLRLQDDGTTWLTWEWPPGIDHCEIHCFEGLDDVDPIRRDPVRKAMYLAQGGWRLPLKRCGCSVHLRQEIDGHAVLSAGIRSSPAIEIAYALVPPGRGQPRCRLAVRLRGDDRLPRLVLVEKRDTAPRGRDDGNRVLVTKATLVPESRMVVLEEFDADLTSRRARFRLCALDPEETIRTEIIEKE